MRALYVLLLLLCAGPSLKWAQAEEQRKISDREALQLGQTLSDSELSAEDAWLRQYMHIFGSDSDMATVKLPAGTHRSTAPEFPSQADGAVKMDFLVDEQGRITRKVPLSGDAEHLEVADEVTERWRFHPWLVNEKPVAFHTVMTISFRKSLDGPAGGIVGLQAMAADQTLAAQAPTGGAEPVYTEAARAAHVEGVVILHVKIDEKGAVEVLSVVSGPPLLRKTAIDIARSRTFEPFMKDGKPTQKITDLQIAISNH